jgi:hypothetical protein
VYQDLAGNRIGMQWKKQRLSKTELALFEPPRVSPEASGVLQLFQHHYDVILDSSVVTID